MDKLLCPCTKEVIQKNKMGIIIYEHKKDKQRCPYLHEGDGEESLNKNLNDNFVEFSSLYLFNESIRTLIIDGKINKENVIITELKKLYGKEKEIIEYFENRKKQIEKNDKGVGDLIYTFGRQIKIILKKLGVVSDGRMYVESPNYIDLGINIKSDYDVMMEELERNKKKKQIERRVM